MTTAKRKALLKPGTDALDKLRKYDALDRTVSHHLAAMDMETAGTNRPPASLKPKPGYISLEVLDDHDDKFKWALLDGGLKARGIERQMLRPGAANDLRASLDDCAADKYPFTDKDTDPHFVYFSPRKVRGYLDLAASCTRSVLDKHFPTGEVDWRPRETIPEDYSAIAWTGALIGGALLLKALLSKSASADPQQGGA